MIGPEILNTLSLLHQKGYDTVICLVFDKSAETYEKVKRQIENIGPEIFLFLQYLQRLKIITPEMEKCWEVGRNEDNVIINPDGAEPQVWKIFSESGEIPKEYRRPEQPLMSRYEIKLAVLHNSLETHPLFVYFPTAVLFPFPLIAHTTFELTDNRQHLIESDINKFIAKRLAKLIADSAEKLVDPENPWNALMSVTPRGDIDPVLTRLGFEENLKSEITSRKIIPVRCKQFDCAKNVKWIDGDFNDLLVGEEFKDICLYTEDEYLKQRLFDIGVKPIQYDDLKERLDKLSRTAISMDIRAEIIYRLIENGIMRDGVPPPELLIDENGSPIPAGTKAWLPPEGKKFSLPEWVPQRIVNSELAALLKDKFGLTRVRDLVSRLRAFEVQEYSMATLVSSIVAETNRQVREDPKNELKFRQKMLQAIWVLYSAQKSEEKPPALPETINIILPARDGSFRPANTLYIGNDYPEGEILEYFYGALGGPFVANFADLGLHGDVNEIKSFLCWLGVADLPRIVKIGKERGDFVDNVLENIQYPAKFGDIIVDEKDKVNGMYPRVENLTFIDRLEEVLKTADPHAIIAWIVRYGEKLNDWRVSGDVDAKLGIFPPYKQYRRYLEGQTIPSYPLWVLQNTKWLPLAGGNKQCPSMCILAKGVSKEVSALVGYPSLNLEHPLLKSLKIDKTAVKNALTIAGVVTELDELSWDSFYEILLELPQKDPEGKVARSVYRALVGRSDSDNPFGEKYSKFMQEGKMFGRLGEKTGYFPINQLYYFENPTLPESMLKLFPSLDLDRRRGALKVKKLFGVEPFNLSTANIKIIEFEEHPCAQDFQKEVEGLKPYIYALRIEEDSDRSELRSLQQLQVKLCKSAKCSIRIGNEEKEISLQSGESIIVDSVVYLVAEPLEYDKPFLRDEIIADALGDVITNILKVEIGGDIARLATCSNARIGVLLDKITGGSGGVRLSRALELMQLPLVSEEEEFMKPIPIPAPIPSPVQPTSTLLPANEPSPSEPSDVVRPSSVGPVVVSGGDQVQIVQPREIKQRIKVNSKPKSEALIKRPLVNPDRAENLALEFEKTQGRFAEKVSHFQGSEAYGCDILSFKNKEDLESFKSKPNMKLVERFIEVKGSVNSVGAVTLKGNELKCAQENRNKYFVYRVYEGEKTGVFELVETPDPLGVETGAMKVQYEIHPFRTKCSRRWDVIEINESEDNQATTQE
jgi:hypothetical protein